MAEFILWSQKRRRCLEKRLDNGCVEWVGARDKWGYGRVSDGNGGSMFAHRKSWEKHRGEIPSGMLICHHCDNPACINPEHLFIGSNLDNVRDMVAKGRSHVLYGEESPRAKINDDMVSMIRSLKGKATYKELMGISGLRKSQVYNILSSKQRNNLKEKTHV